MKITLIFIFASREDMCMCTRATEERNIMRAKYRCTNVTASAYKEKCSRWVGSTQALGKQAENTEPLSLVPTEALGDGPWYS